jgi:hypothetical protein
MKHARLALLVIAVVLASQSLAVAAAPTPLAAPSAVDASPVCNGKFRDGLKPSPAEVAEILRKHVEWLNDGGRYKPKLTNDPRRANLCETLWSSSRPLGSARLAHADLAYTQVSKAKLGYVDLTHAIYAPASEPPDPYVAGIKGLAMLNAARGEEIGLIQLRKLLQDAGLRDKVFKIDLLQTFFRFFLAAFYLY